MVESGHEPPHPALRGPELLEPVRLPPRVGAGDVGTHADRAAGAGRRADRVARRQRVRRRTRRAPSPADETGSSMTLLHRQRGRDEHAVREQRARAPGSASRQIVGLRELRARPRPDPDARREPRHDRRLRDAKVAAPLVVGTLFGVLWVSRAGGRRRFRGRPSSLAAMSPAGRCGSRGEMELMVEARQLESLTGFSASCCTTSRTRSPGSRCRRRERSVISAIRVPARRHVGRRAHRRCASS